MNRIFTTALCLTMLAASASAQKIMSLDEAIHTARSQSVEALEAKQAFISTYWAYRSYKASRLPSVYLYGDIMNFDRSLTLLQNPDDGSLKYVSSNNLQNGMGVQINQNIPLGFLRSLENRPVRRSEKPHLVLETDHRIILPAPFQLQPVQMGQEDRTKRIRKRQEELSRSYGKDNHQYRGCISFSSAGQDE